MFMWTGAVVRGLGWTVSVVSTKLVHITHPLQYCSTPELGSPELGSVESLISQLPPTAPTALCDELPD